MLNAIVGFVQEYKAEQSIESLKKMMSLQSRVIRDGPVSYTHLDVYKRQR